MVDLIKVVCRVQKVTHSEQCSLSYCEWSSVRVRFGYREWHVPKSYWSRIVSTRSNNFCMCVPMEWLTVELLRGLCMDRCIWIHMLSTLKLEKHHDRAQVGAPNCKYITFDTARQVFETLNTCWFYMIHTHDCAHVGAPNCKSTISGASRQLLKTERVGPNLT